MWNNFYLKIFFILSFIFSVFIPFLSSTISSGIKSDPFINPFSFRTYISSVDDKEKNLEEKIFCEAILMVEGKLGAVVRKKEERVVIMQGDFVWGWLVESISLNKVLLKKGERRVVVEV